MWLVSNSDGQDILFENLDDVKEFLQRVNISEGISLRYVPKFMKEEKEEDKPEKKIYPELVPLSRAKEN